MYDNPWITVSHHEVVTPAGSDGVYGVVHFKNIAVGVVPIDEQGNTWLVGQYRYPLQQRSWEIPEGGCPENSEPPLRAAQRELEEETGLKADHWIQRLQLHLSNSVTDERAVIFTAEKLSAGQMHHEDTEDIEIRRLPLREALAMVERGEITDAISVAALLRVSRLPEYADYF